MVTFAPPKTFLHHKAVLGKLDADAVKLGHPLKPPRLVSTPTKTALPPVKGLHKLQHAMIQSLQDVCAKNQEAMGSFIEKQKEKRQQQQKENQDCNGHNSTSGSLNELKNMLNAVDCPETPKSKPLDFWQDGGATPLRKRYRKHHDQYMLEKNDVAQAVQSYRCKFPRKSTVEV